MQNDIPQWLRAHLNICMLGRIHPDIRAITVNFDEKNRYLSIKSYLSRSASQDDLEDMEELITELWSMSGEHFDNVDFDCIFSKESRESLNLLNNLIFRMKE